MRKKIFVIARRGFSFCSNSKLTASRLSVPRTLKWGSLEINNSVGQSNIQWREWSYAASVLSDKPNAQKGRKRVSRDERRAMVESFVNNYRAENAGKFPKVHDAMKQVGGNYYVVRKTIQELEYRSKMTVSNRMDENLVGKELLNEEKPLTTETVKVSPGNTEGATDMTVQDDCHLDLVDLEDNDIVSVDHKHLKEIGPLTSSWESSASQEAMVTTSLGGPFIEAKCNLLERDAGKPSQSSLNMSNDVTTVEVQSSCSHSVALESPLLDEEIVHLSVPSSPKAGSSQSKTESPDSEFADMENHLIMEEEECVQKSRYERRKQALECMAEEPSLSTLEMLDDVKTEQAESISLSSVASDSHLLKEAIEQPSGSYSQAQSLDSEFVYMENHLISEEKSIEKARLGRGEQAALGDLPIMDDQKHKTEHFQRSSDLDESKTDHSKREISDTEKSTLWKNLKSFADGILNIWRKF